MPSGTEGAGDGRSWYDWTVQEVRRKVGESEMLPPYPIGTTPAKRDALSQIYNYVVDRDTLPATLPMRLCEPTIQESELKG